MFVPDRPFHTSQMFAGKAYTFPLLHSLEGSWPYPYIKLGWKGLPWTNIVNYGRKNFYKTFYGCILLIFVPVRPFQPSQMFAGKAYTFQLLHSMEGSWPYPQTLN
jgi:hypothetical protein